MSYIGKDGNQHSNSMTFKNNEGKVQHVYDAFGTEADIRRKYNIGPEWQLVNTGNEGKSMPTNDELRHQINQKEAEISALERQIQEQTPADGVWNPADYISARYNKQNGIAGKDFKRNFGSIPEDAQKYIQEQIYKRQQSGYPVTKDFLRMLQANVNYRWFDDLPKGANGRPNWDISAFWSTDKGMAKALNANKTFSYGQADSTSTTDTDTNTTVEEKPKDNVPVKNTDNTDNTVKTPEPVVASNTPQAQGSPTSDGKLYDSDWKAEQRAKANEGHVPQETNPKPSTTVTGTGKVYDSDWKAEQRAKVKTESDDINKNTVEQISNGSTVSDAVSDTSMPVQNDEPDYAALINKITSPDDKDLANSYLRRINFSNKEIAAAKERNYSDEMVKTYKQEIATNTKLLKDLLTQYNLL